MTLYKMNMLRIIQAAAQFGSVRHHSGFQLTVKCRLLINELYEKYQIEKRL